MNSYVETYQFEDQFKHYAIDANFIGGEIQSTGLSFDNYQRMHTETRKLNRGRRGPAPDWAFNAAQLRQIIVRNLEMRASFRKPLPGSDQVRLAAAQKVLIEKCRPAIITALEGLCADYVAAKKRGDVTRADFLAPKIEESDTQIRFIDRAPQILAGVVWHYYRCGLDSVATASALGFKPPHVRALLWRLGKTAGELGYVPRKAVKHRPKNAERARASRFAGLLYGKDCGGVGKTWAQAKAAMGEPDTHNGQFRRILKKYGLWKPRHGAPSFHINVTIAARLRAEGRGYPEIGKRLGVSAYVVMYALRRAGKDTPTKWHNNPHRGRVDLVEAKRLRAEGWTYRRIARHFGVCTNAVWNRLRYKGKHATDSNAPVGRFASTDAS